MCEDLIKEETNLTRAQSIAVRYKLFSDTYGNVDSQLIGLVTVALNEAEKRGYVHGVSCAIRSVDIALDGLMEKE